MKELKGGGPRSRFFSQSWTLSIDAVTEVSREDVSLVAENQRLQEKVALLQRDMNSKPISRKRTAKHYSKRHERHIKNSALVTACPHFLGWKKKALHH